MTVKSRLVFYTEVKGDDDCWLWKASKNARGYGKIKVDRKMMYAHIEVYKNFVGYIPPGLYVLHKCSNTSCCNPRHLTLGTQARNIRQASLEGACQRGLLGITGVYLQTDKHMFRAFHTHGGRKVYLYNGKDFFEACCARKSWEARQ